MHERPYWWRDDDHPRTGFYGGERREQRRGDRPHWWAGRDLPQHDDHLHPEDRRRDTYEGAYSGYDDTSHYDDGRGDDRYVHADDHHRHEDHNGRRRPRWARKVRAFLGNDRDDRRAHHRNHDDRPRDYRGVGPRTRHDEDEELRDMICQRLSDDPDLDASNIIVRVIDNEAILDGSVRSKHDARNAYESALDIPGIVHVRERLQIVGRGRDRVRRATIGMGYEESRRRLS